MRAEEAEAGGDLKPLSTCQLIATRCRLAYLLQLLASAGEGAAAEVVGLASLRLIRYDAYPPRLVQSMHFFAGGPCKMAKNSQAAQGMNHPRWRGNVAKDEEESRLEVASACRHSHTGTATFRRSILELHLRDPLFDCRRAAIAL